MTHKVCFNPHPTQELDAIDPIIKLKKLQTSYHLECDCYHVGVFLTDTYFSIAHIVYNCNK